MSSQLRARTCQRSLRQMGISKRGLPPWERSFDGAGGRWWMARVQGVQKWINCGQLEPNLQEPSTWRAVSYIPALASLCLSSGRRAEESQIWGLFQLSNPLLVALATKKNHTFLINLIRQANCDSIFTHQSTTFNFIMWQLKPIIANLFSKKCSSPSLSLWQGEQSLNLWRVRVKWETTSFYIRGLHVYLIPAPPTLPRKKLKPREKKWGALSYK